LLTKNDPEGYVIMNNFIWSGEVRRKIIITIGIALLVLTSCESLYDMAYSNGELTLTNNTGSIITMVEIVPVESEWGDANLLLSVIEPGSIWYYSLLKDDYKMRISIDGEEEYPMIRVDFSTVEQIDISLEIGGIQ